MRQQTPLVLLSINTRSRDLVLVSPSTDVVPFVVVALARSVAGDPFAYLLGRRYGDRAVDVVIRRAGGRSLTLRRSLNVARRAGALAVLAAPGAVVCALVGAAGMGARRFLLLNVTGTLVRVALVRSVGETFADPITSFVSWVDQRRYALIGLMAVVLVVGRLLTRREPEQELTVADAVHDLEQAPSVKQADGD